MSSSPEHRPALAADLIDLERHPIDDAEYVDACRRRLADSGALVLEQFVHGDVVDAIVDSVRDREAEAFYASSTHNVYLRPDDPSHDPQHPRNRPIVSSKGLIADDELPADSALRAIYDDPSVRSFLARVVGVDQLHPYDDDVSSINVHFAPHGRELGWHFDNSAFAVTLLLQAPEGGGAFEYVPALRDADAGDDGFDPVREVLDGERSTKRLEFDPGSLVVFRGRDALHRVTPTEGDVTRILVVFAFNEQPGIRLSDSALETFYGRLG